MCVCLCVCVCVCVCPCSPIPQQPLRLGPQSSVESSPMADTPTRFFDLDPKVQGRPAAGDLS